MIHFKFPQHNQSILDQEFGLLIYLETHFELPARRLKTIKDIKIKFDDPYKTVPFWEDTIYYPNAADIAHFPCPYSREDSKKDTSI